MCFLLKYSLRLAKVFAEFISDKVLPYKMNNKYLKFDDKKNYEPKLLK